MRLFLFVCALLCSTLPAQPAIAAKSFVLVNGTSSPLSGLAIRRFGTEDWTPLALNPPAGGQGPVDFDDPDCAFDIRAKAGDRQLLWSGVNLCEAKIVTLRRSEKTGALWVDYS